MARTIGQLKTDNGQSESETVEQYFANGMSRGFDGKCQLTEVQRPLTGSLIIGEVAQPFGYGERQGDGKQVRSSAAFGIDRGIAGFCPGRALVVLGRCHAKILAFLAAMFSELLAFNTKERFAQFTE